MLTARATTGYLKQCGYSIRLRFRSSSLIPAYRKRIGEEAVWNCQLWLWIYKGPADQSPDRHGDSILSILRARFVRVCVNRVAMLLAHRFSVEREPAAARFPWSCWRRPAACISFVFRATPVVEGVLYFTSGCIWSRQIGLCQISAWKKVGRRWAASW